MPTLYEQLEIPEAFRNTSIHPGEGEFIHNLLAGREVTATLETGFAYGCSAAHIMTASQAPHVAVDPWVEITEIGMRNIDRLELGGRLELIHQPSHVALPALAARGLAVDFFFIDGGHLFEDVFLDWTYANLLVKPGGQVVFHDRWLKATQYAASFIRANRSDWREIATPWPNLYLFQRVEGPIRNWWEMADFGAEGHPAPARRAAAAAARQTTTHPRAAKMPAHIAYRIRGPNR